MPLPPPGDLLPVLRPPGPHAAQEVFSLMLLDDGSRVMEPEGVVSLTMVGPSTRVVMVGDLLR